LASRMNAMLQKRKMVRTKELTDPEAELARLRKKVSLLKKALLTKNFESKQSDENIQVLREELKKSREQTRVVIETASDAFIGTDQRGLIIDWDRQAENTFGWSRSEVLGLPFADILISPRFRAAYDENIQRFVETGDGQIFINRRFQTTALDRTMREFPIELSVWPVEGGGAYRFNAFVRDMSERKRLENLKNEFVSTVSHELRTPMTIIREGVSQVVDGLLGSINDDQKQFLNISLSGIDRLTRIINELLDFSKIESGKVELRKERTDLVKLARDVSAHFKSNAKEKGLELNLKLSHSNVELYLDKDKTVQILTNLIANAIKFTEKGHIDITITEKEKMVECVVSDTGRGITARDLPNVFGKFQQFGRQFGPGEKGTGLGLAICRGLVELHGGSITVASEAGTGTAFTFALPKFSARQIFLQRLVQEVSEAMKHEEPLSVLLLTLSRLDLVHKMVGEERFREIQTKLNERISKELRSQDDQIVSDAPHVLATFRRTKKEDALLVGGRLQHILDDMLHREKLNAKVGVGCRVVSFPDEATNADDLLNRLFQ
jgi:PAS domain S-box-containing protein